MQTVVFANGGAPFANRGASLDRRRKAVAARSWPRRRGCGAARIRLMRAGGRVGGQPQFFKAAINERDRLIGRGFLPRGPARLKMNSTLV